MYNVSNSVDLYSVMRYFWDRYVHCSRTYYSTKLQNIVNGFSKLVCCEYVVAILAMPQWLRLSQRVCLVLYSVECTVLVVVGDIHPNHLVLAFFFLLKIALFSKQCKKNWEAMPLAMLPTKSRPHCQDQMIRAIGALK